MNKPGIRDNLRAVVVLTADAVRRLLRQGLVVRSLVFPGAIATFTLMATVMVVVYMRAPPEVALSPSVANAAFVDKLEAAEFVVHITDDPGKLFEDEDLAIATDGKTLWIGAGGRPPVQLEAIVREELNTVWRPTFTEGARKKSIQDPNTARPLAVFIGALFSMYGVVFAAGGVARDRSEGTLDAELAMAVPHWVHGMARWLSSTVLLSLFYAFSVFLLNATLGVKDPVSDALHGSAACGIAAAIGLFVVGRSGLDKGFAGIMAAGLFSWMTLVSVGMGLSEYGQYMPGVSLYIRDASPYPPVVLSCVAGCVASVVFAKRTAVQ